MDNEATEPFNEAATDRQLLLAVFEQQKLIIRMLERAMPMVEMFEAVADNPLGALMPLLNGTLMPLLNGNDGDEISVPFPPNALPILKQPGSEQ